MKRLMVAAGGGGDALAAAMLHAAEHGDEPAMILTYSWDRLIVDPVPGPRSAEDFTGLDQVAPNVLVFHHTTRAIQPMRSSLPQLADPISPELALLDPTNGAQGMTRQINAAVRYTKADRIEVIDVGGDAVARGDEPGLRSPLADALVLAACADADVPTSVTVAGPGLDGELPEADVLARFDAPTIRVTAEHTAPFLPIFEWHPSEATSLLAAAAHGIRGTCEVREAGLPVAITDASANAYRVDLDDVLEVNELSRRLIETTTLPDAEAITRDICGFSELDHERNKATWLSAQPRTPQTGMGEARDTLAKFLTEAAARGSDYVTWRRIAEALNLNRSALGNLRRLLTNFGPVTGQSLIWPTGRTL